MEIHVDAFIDNEYIQNGGQKIDMYQRLAVVSSKEELDELRRELEDRYGRPSSYVEKLLQVTETRLEAKAQGMVPSPRRRTSSKSSGAASRTCPI